MTQKGYEIKVPIEMNTIEGNPFYLVSKAVDIATVVGYSSERTQEIIRDMTSKDYKHLVKVFQEEFSDFVTLNG
jgi:hypothetical protein